VWALFARPHKAFYSIVGIRNLLFNKIPGFTWRGGAAPSETWDFTGIFGHVSNVWLVVVGEYGSG
jgi:hypothetical protein